MSLSPITSSSSFFTDNLQSFQQRRTAFQQLGQSLQSGDLSAAQSAFNTLTQNSPANQNGPLSQDLSAVGQALQSGDLQGAQTAFAKLQQDAKTQAEQQQGTQGAHHGHHHHHQAESTSTTDSTSQTDPNSLFSTTSPSDTPGSTVNITA
jgi:hypothetical protein